MRKKNTFRRAAARKLESFFTPPHSVQFLIVRTYSGFLFLKVRQNPLSSFSEFLSYTYSYCTWLYYRFASSEAEFMMFLGIILRVLKLEVFVYNVYITKQFQTTFARGGGVKKFFMGV